MEDEDLLIVPVPALVAVLLAAETDKGSPLTQAEVESIRDTAACIAMPRDARDAIAEQRGYDDINPENVWDEWRLARETLA